MQVHESEGSPGAQCRAGCGACCIAPSIRTPMPGMPAGKPAGVRCVNLDAQLRCTLFGSPLRPSFCCGLKASQQMCGNHRDEAIAWLTELEHLTRP